MGKKLTTEEFIVRAKDVHGDKYDYSMVEYNGMHQHISIICKHHGIFNQRPEKHLKHGCNDCGFESSKSKLTLSTSEFICRSVKIHGNTYDYSKVNYIDAFTPVTIICVKHGEFPQKPTNHLNYCGCPKCNTSKGELKISQWLIDNNIQFTQQKTFEGCINKIPLRFDFYLPNYNTVIEYHGKQHYTPIKYFGGDVKYQNQKCNDNIKVNYCNDHNIHTITISFSDFKSIAKILKKELI